MSTADNSYRIRTTRMKAKTLAAFHTLNPQANEFFGSQGSEHEYLIRKLGQRAEVIQPPNAPAYETSGCCGQPCEPLVISNFVVDNFTYVGGTIWNIYLSWSVNQTSVSYSFSIPTPGVVTDPVFVQTGATSATLTIADLNGYFAIQITGTNSCGSSTATIENFAPCFLAGTPVTMADGTSKPIEEVAVGDLVLGAFGETNEVLALHRPLLGMAKMSKINGEHSSSSHHPHISVDKKFYCQHPSTVMSGTYGKEHDVITKDGTVEKRLLLGLKKERILELTVGVVLKTVEGSREVKTLETYSLPPDTQLYNLVVGGSHTYHVDGYAVTGWPREDDFDYDAWHPKN